MQASATDGVTTTSILAECATSKARYWRFTLVTENGQTKIRSVVYGQNPLRLEADSSTQQSAAPAATPSVPPASQPVAQSGVKSCIVADDVKFFPAGRTIKLNDPYSYFYSDTVFFKADSTTAITAAVLVVQAHR